MAAWHALNVTAFLTSGIVAQWPAIIGEPYVDPDGNAYNPMSVQPVIILEADKRTISNIHRRSLKRQIKTCLYIEEMFSTGHDVANRAVFATFAPDDAKDVGVAIRADKKVVDKIAKGASMHP